MKTFNKFSSLRSEQSQISEAQFSKQDLEDMANLEESEISKNNLEPVQALSYPQDNPPQQNNQSHEGHQHGPNCVHSHSEHEHTSECFKSSKEDKISKDTLLAELNKLSVARIKNYLLLGLFAVDQETKNHVCYSCTQEISSRFSFLKAPTQIESFQDNLYGFEDICNTVMNNSIESQLREIFETSLKDSQVDLKDPLSLTQQEVQKIRTVYTKALLKKFSACLKSVNCSCGAPLFVPLLSTSQTFITRENFEVSVAPKAYEQLFLKLKGLINYSITNSFFENLKNPALQNNLPSQDIFYKSALINKELFLQKKGPQFVLRGTFLGLTENCDLIEYLSSNEAQMENLALSKALSNSFKQHLQINQDQTKTLSESKVFVQDGRDLSYTDIDFLKLKDYKSFLNLDIDGTSTNAPNFGSTKLDFLLFKFLAFLQKKKLMS